MHAELFFSKKNEFLKFLKKKYVFMQEKKFFNQKKNDYVITEFLFYEIHYLKKKLILFVDLGVLIKIEVDGKIRKAVLTAGHVVASKTYFRMCQYVHVYIPIAENYNQNFHPRKPNGSPYMKTKCFKKHKIRWADSPTKINIFARNGFLETFSAEFGDDIGIILLPDDVFEDVGKF